MHRQLHYEQLIRFHPIARDHDWNHFSFVPWIIAYVNKFEHTVNHSSYDKERRVSYLWCLIKPNQSLESFPEYKEAFQRWVYSMISYYRYGYKINFHSYSCISSTSSSKSSVKMLKLMDIPATKLTKSMKTIEIWLLRSAILFKCGFIARFARIEDIRDSLWSLFAVINYRL